MSYQTLSDMSCRLPCNRYLSSSDLFEGEKFISRPKTREGYDDSSMSSDVREGYDFEPSISGGGGIENFDYPPEGAATENYQQIEEPSNCGRQFQKNSIYRNPGCFYNQSPSWVTQTMFDRLPPMIVSSNVVPVMFTSFDQELSRREQATCNAYLQNPTSAYVRGSCQNYNWSNAPPMIIQSNGTTAAPPVMTQIGGEGGSGGSSMTTPNPYPPQQPQTTAPVIYNPYLTQQPQTTAPVVYNPYVPQQPQFPPQLPTSQPQPFISGVSTDVSTAPPYNPYLTTQSPLLSPVPPVETTSISGVSTPAVYNYNPYDSYNSSPSLPPIPPAQFNPYYTPPPPNIGTFNPETINNPLPQATFESPLPSSLTSPKNPETTTSITSSPTSSQIMLNPYSQSQQSSSTVVNPYVISEGYSKVSDDCGCGMPYKLSDSDKYNQSNTWSDQSKYRQYSNSVSNLF